MTRQIVRRSWTTTDNASRRDRLLSERDRFGETLARATSRRHMNHDSKQPHDTDPPRHPAHDPTRGIPTEERPRVRPASPVRSTAHERKLEDVVLEARPDEGVEIDFNAPAPMARPPRDPRLHAEAARVAHLRRQYHLRQTLLPSAIVLALSCWTMAGGWFLLDPMSGIRDNELGMALPAGLASLGMAFAGVAVVLLVQVNKLAAVARSAAN